MSDRPGPDLPRRTLRGWALRGAMLAAGLGLVGWLVVSTWEPRPARRNPPVRTQAHAPAHDPAPAPRAAAVSSQIDSAVARDALAAIEPAVGMIEADGPAGLTPLGAAFVVEADGLVATNYHVIAETTVASLRLRSGAVYEVDGYYALDRESDLAILRLRAAPSLTKVRLAKGEPAPLEPVFALGHPHGVEFSPFDGKVSRILTTSQLAPATRRFVRQLTLSERDHPWIQHTATLSDGNSGGPLVSAIGEVLGINTWTDRQSGFGYALAASEIAALLQNPLPEIEPLARHASSEARLRSVTWQASAAQLRALAEEARAMRWQPATVRDYEKLQQLAWGIALANRPQISGSRAALGDRLDGLVKAADRVVAQLRQEKWDEIGQITLLNEFAAEEVQRPLAGLIFIGTLERIVEGAPGQRAAIVVLAGFEQRLLVPLESALTLPAAGSQCLFVGVNDRGRTVQYGDNPLQPVVAPIIYAPVIIELGR